MYGKQRSKDQSKDMSKISVENERTVVLEVESR